MYAILVEESKCEHANTLYIKRQHSFVKISLILVNLTSTSMYKGKPDKMPKEIC